MTAELGVQIPPTCINMRFTLLEFFGLLTVITLYFREDFTYKAIVILDDLNLLLPSYLFILTYLVYRLVVRLFGTSELNEHRRALAHLVQVVPLGCDGSSGGFGWSVS